MNQILYSKQIRSDRLRDVLGIFVVFSLASFATIVSAQSQSPPARIFLLLTSAILFALGIRGIFFYFQHFSYSFVVGTETITWGWVHKPRQQAKVQVVDITEAHWPGEENDTRVRLRLKDNETVNLPIHLASVPREELRKLFEQHFPHIKSSD